MAKNLQFSKYSAALEHIATFPGCNKSVIAKKFNLELSDLLDAITHWFGGLSGLDEASFKEVAAAQSAGATPPLPAAPAAPAKPEPAPDRRPRRESAPPVAFKPAPELPGDFVELPPATAAGTRGYDAIFRACAAKPEFVIPRSVASKLALIEKVGGPSETLKAFAVDLLFSESTHKIMIRRRTTPGGFMLRAATRGGWRISSLQLKKAPVPGKYILKLETNRSDHAVFAPVDTTTLAKSV